MIPKTQQVIMKQVSSVLLLSSAVQEKLHIFLLPFHTISTAPGDFKFFNASFLNDKVFNKPKRYYSFILDRISMNDQ